jgi:hypothetical protein
MHARIARFEGDPSSIDEMIDGIRKDVESGARPPGLEDATGIMVMVDRSTGQSLGITFFADEAGLKRGDAALNAMSPDGEGRRTSVEIYEVPISMLDQA